MEASWAAPGVEVMCIRDNWGLVELTQACPKFMQKYTIQDAYIMDDEDEGHMVKLRFSDHPDMRGRFAEFGWCSCGFRPLEKLKREEHKDTTAPVTPELVDG